MERKKFIRLFFTSLIFPLYSKGLLLKSSPQVAQFLWFVGRQIVVPVLRHILIKYAINEVKDYFTFKRAYYNNNYNSYAEINGKPTYEKNISKEGKTRTGSIQIGQFGYSLKMVGEKNGIWVPSQLMWAAVNEKNISGNLDLSSQRCGYPVDIFYLTQYNDFAVYEQRFEKGTVKIVVPNDIKDDGEKIYNYNKERKIWFP
jgi:hypothetical protein